MSNKSEKQSNVWEYLLNGCGYCLVLLICLGPIAIALPSFINEAYKGKTSEAKMYVGSMNRAQQADFLDNNTFTNDIQKLGLGINTETVNYSYSIQATKNAAFHYGVAKTKWLKSYIGGVFLVPATQVDTNVAKNKMTTVAILCETNSFSTTKPLQPTYKNGVLTCPEGTSNLSR
ncbi:MAG TPA: general secretion pathway protein GspH [Cyanobacteria bacterium UBA11149]|nr:general secretion pathway protein GspH [Cyanobacteria bacterium UBA11367]HBE57623.1 general secretion pathway protein GspH [Cyanobacteria bacterium UBA11366]HBK62148.1 general secretion pathway protein GspH [Cyanobacteria bacterium UBA11166]HBR73166.1 general secretion pathway protein GspH [Cyanobacteria bacterium UBA11159]HBS69560.1 general secretion pathway protein GspH [Cyanobacteria bacterium UBA11153]HBW88052.1 general secretion pathway protein GspH [Cyanobacteria bacterium UBA11149]H